MVTAPDLYCNLKKKKKLNNLRWVTSVAGSWPIYHLPHFPQYFVYSMLKKLHEYSCTKVCKHTQGFILFHEFLHEYVRVLTPFLAKYAITNEIHFQPNSC